MHNTYGESNYIFLHTQDTHNDTLRPRVVIIGYLAKYNKMIVCIRQFPQQMHKWKRYVVSDQKIIGSAVAA